MDGAGNSFIDDQTAFNFYKFNAVRLLIHKDIGETAFAALARHDGKFAVKEFAIRNFNGTEF